TLRLHTGSAAARAADSVGARAFALGHDIVFAAGEFRPDTRDGQRLLAHEVSHIALGHSGVRRQCAPDATSGPVCEPLVGTFILDPALANAAVRQARLGPVLFVVRDLRFEPYIKRMLARLEVPANIIERIRFCDPTGIDRAVSQIRGAGALFVSRLVETEVGRRIPSGWRRLPPAPFIDAASLELLRARVTLADVEREGPLAGLAGAAAAKGAERRPEAQH
ncbi:MAG TPA: DUF4157 domain-containing protein, partial [Acidobacteriota bacterium]|nr:DUF4157 domain-containing protein [Acidobacteriota bacterium]